MRWYAFLLIGSLACSSSTAGEPTQGEESRPEVQLDHDTHQVTRFDAKRRPRWTTTLDGDVGRGLPPHVVWDAKRVFVTHKNGVTALDAKTGKVLWHSDGANNAMLLNKDLLLAAGWSPTRHTKDCWLLARSVQDGKTAFKVTVDVTRFDPLPIRVLAGLFLIQSWECDACLVDREGVIRHRIRSQVLAGLRKGNDAVLLTAKDVMCLSPDDKVRWTIPFDRHEWIADGSFIELSAGDLVAFRYGCIRDSGVDVIRLTPGTGKTVWQTKCSGLRVAHSKYKHDAAVMIERETIRVTSRGSYGTFEELLDLKTGRQLTRNVHRDE